MKKAIMFDFDGTLVDSMNELADKAVSLINKYYELSDSIARKLYIETCGLPFCEQMEIIFPGGSKNQQIVEEFELDKEKSFWNYKVFTGTGEAIEYLRSKGIVVAVSSNNFDYIIREYFEHQGIMMDEYLGFKENEQFYKGKPHFDFINKKYGIGYENMVFIGDSIKDGEKAINNNIEFIGRIGTNPKNLFESNFGNIKTIDNILELKELF